MSGGKNKQVRLDARLYERLERLEKKSGLTISDVIRLGLNAGLPLLENGEVNPFGENNVAGVPPPYRRKKRTIQSAAKVAPDPSLSQNPASKKAISSTK